MGEVYRAKDTRLGRSVAVKILPQSLSGDAERLRRFEQEARAVAALNHPNILALFDVGQHDGGPFLVSELLEGETLRAGLEGVGFPPRKAVDYGVQIANALAAAHERGIIHRDLKPENVFVTKDGHVKVLDFGLAKLAEGPTGDSEGVTRTGLNTARGVVLGTASYMAPEQVRGEETDPRTDIFSFGAVLYEMLSGTRAFRRDTAAETMTAVLKEEPSELSDPGRPVAPALDRIVRRCLEKKPEQRFQSAKDLSFALGALSGQESSAAMRAAVAGARLPARSWLWVPLALAGVAAGTWWVAQRPRQAQRMEFVVPVPADLSVSHMALSRDGSMIAFVSPEEKTGLPMLYVQRIGSSNATQLSGTQGASYPFWSPDGATIAFFAGGKLQKIPSSGGSPQAIAVAPSARGGSWGKRDVIVYTPSAENIIWRVNPDGTGAARVTNVTAKENSHRWPVFLPDGNHFLYWAGDFANTVDDRLSGIYLSSLDQKERKLVVLCHSSAGYDSHNLYYADDQRRLVRVAFDPRTGTGSGGPIPVAGSVGVQPATFWATFAAAENGTLIYNASVGAALSVLTWVDRSGQEVGRVGEAAIMANPSLSPDGNRVAVDISDPKANNVDIWLENTSGSGSSRFTFDPSEEVVAVWSHDGTTIAYRGAYSGSTMVLKRANLLEREKGLISVSGLDDVIPNCFTPDDRQILYTRQTGNGDYLELIPVAGGERKRFLESKGSQANGQISPDGKMAAYASDESGSWEVYATSFPGAAGKWQVSRGGGTEPRWRGDGREIFYIGPTGMLMAVPVTGENGFATGTPVPLFPPRVRAPISSTDVFAYDVAKDGKRFLVNRYVHTEHVPLTILLNAGSTSAP
jgi:Tol biopolymer transport system component